MATRVPGDLRYGPPLVKEPQKEVEIIVETKQPVYVANPIVNKTNSHRKIFVTGTVTRDKQRCDFVGNYKKWFEQRIIDYCKHWNYEYIPFFDYPVTERGRTHPVWMKHWIFLELFPKVNDGDVISYIDSDIAILRGDIDIVCPEEKSIAFSINKAYKGIGAWNNGVYSMRVNDYTRQFVANCWGNHKYDGAGCPDLDCWNDELLKLSKKEWDEKIYDLPHYINCMSSNVGLGVPPFDKSYGNVPRELIRFRHFANEDDIRRNPSKMESWLSQPLTFK